MAYLPKYPPQRRVYTEANTLKSSFPKKYLGELKMMNLGTFENKMRVIRDSVAKANQLEALLEQVNALTDKLFDETRREQDSYHLSEVIDAAQASFENLSCAIEAEISDAKNIANLRYFEIANEMFLPNEKSAR